MQALASPPFITQKRLNYKEKVAQLAEALRSHSVVGQALRTLSKRVVNPYAPHTPKDLETLLLLSLALRRTQERK